MDNLTPMHIEHIACNNRQICVSRVSAEINKFRDAEFVAKYSVLAELHEKYIKQKNWR